jgi:hypothetical protein
MKAKKPRWMERSHRADHNFAVASIALVIFFLVAGISTWMLGSTAIVDPAGSVSSTANAH